MNIDVHHIEESYRILTQYIPTKDKQEAADNIVSYLVDVLDELDLKTFCAEDKYLNNAYKQYDLVDYSDLDEYSDDAELLDDE